MTAYNIVNPGLLVTGQPEDISQVLANFTAIATILNGNVDDGNIKVGAGIQTTKLAALSAYNAGLTVSAGNTDLAWPGGAVVTDYVRVTTGGGTLRSMGAPTLGNGVRMALVNGAAAVFTILHGNSAGTGKALFMQDSVDTVLRPGEAITFEYDGSEWIESSRSIRSPRIITSAMSGGPPANPQDGDVWIATAVDASGTRWQFQYNAGSGSAYKWEFIGGPSVGANIETDEAITSNGTWQDATTAGPKVTLARAGEYFASGGASYYNTTGASDCFIGVAVGATDAAFQQRGYMPTANQLFIQTIIASSALTVTAAQDLRVRYVMNTGTGKVLMRRITVIPRRIS